MPLIPAPPATPDRDTLALRIDRDLHGQLREYAEFLNTTKEYIVSSALRRVFRHDKDFIAWQQRRDAPTAAVPTPPDRVSTGAGATEQSSSHRSSGDAHRRSASKETA